MLIACLLLAGNFLVCRSSHRPALLDFGLTKELSRHMQRALSKMLLATAEVRLSTDVGLLLHHVNVILNVMVSLRSLSCSLR